MTEQPKKPFLYVAACACGIATAALPYLNTAQAAHLAYQQSLERLCGMCILIGKLRAPPARGRR